MRRSVLLLLALVVGGAASEARADDSRFGPYDVRTLFGVAKSTNKNVVEYGIRLDKDCIPVGSEPIYAYWHDYEKGPNETSDLGLLDRSVYGIEHQWVLKRAPDKSTVVLTVKAADDRSITAYVKKRDGRCVGDSFGMIAGAPARIDQIFVHVTGPFSVDWVEIRGTANGKPVVERVKH